MRTSSRIVRRDRKLLRDIRYVSVVEGGDDVLRDLLFVPYVIPVPRRS